MTDPERHVLRFAPGTQRIVGLTVINARQVLDRDGRLIVAVPEAIEATAEDLAPALQAACRPRHEQLAQVLHSAQSRSHGQALESAAVTRKPKRWQLMGDAEATPRWCRIRTFDKRPTWLTIGW